MKLKLLLCVMLFAIITTFSQTYPIHDVDDCKLMYNVTNANAIYADVVTNPVGGDASSNVSSISASLNNGNSQFNLPYKIPTGTVIDWTARFYSANAGSNGSGSGRIIVRLINRSIGGSAGYFLQIGLYNKTGGVWQTESVTGVTATAANAAAIDAAGGFDAILIIASSNASTIEPLYFDNLGFSINPDLSDVTADLDTGKAWLYDNSSNNFNAASINFAISGTVEENQATPSTVGNSSPTVLKYTRGNNSATTGIRFKVPTPFDYTATTLKFRIFAVCNLNAIANFRLQVRFDDSGTGALNYDIQNIEENKWVEFSVDLTSPNTGTPTADNLYTDLYFFMNSGDATSGSNGQVYYFDSIQLTAQTSTFDGDTDSNWGTAANWSNDVLPNSLYNISIPSGQNVTIGATTGATANNLTVDGAGSLTVNAGGSLIVNGTSTGNVTYNRTLDFISGNAKGWHLVGSPVVSETYDNAYATANNLATSGTKRGLATYDTALDTWSYLESDNSNAGTFTSGLGYSLKRASIGTVSFTGTINTADVTPSVLATGNGFNLVSNPYTSYINSGTFLTENTANLVSETIWLWNPVSENYETKVTVNAYTLSPGQGFFVRASGATVNFIESNQSSGTDNFQRSGSTRPEINLMMTDGALNRFAKLYYLENATKGFDNGYDGETFGGIANSLDVFTHLVSDSEGKNFQIQSLPNTDYENMVVQVGLKAEVGKELIFTAEAMNLPNGIKVFLEDRANNTFTDLSNNGSYKVTTTDALNGIGRFYLHTKSSVLSADENVLNTVSIYKTSNSNIRLSGLPQGKSVVKLYNILGMQVMQRSFDSNGVKDISLPKLSPGIYIVQLDNGTGKINKKIILE